MVVNPCNPSTQDARQEARGPAWAIAQDCLSQNKEIR